MSVYNLAAILLSAWSALAASDELCTQNCEVLVNIDSGPVCGRVLLAENSTEYYSFRGLPYAKAPLGEMRFKELEQPDSWTEPYYAHEEGPACPQKDIVYGSIPVQTKGMSEDCIFANVHVPATAELNCESNCDDNALPIMVVVHGGGFQTGSGNTDMHGPEYLMRKDIIMISFNYRINVFGYLSLGSSKIPGNNGLRDILTLLRWVKRNARAFGGNPEDITIYGQSAGAASVHLLTLSEASDGLFNRVILMSGTALGYFFNTSPEFAKYVADLFLENVGINSTDPDEIHQKLIEMPIETIMNSNNIVQYQLGLTSFVPVVETENFSNFTRVLPEDPYKLVGEGRGSQYPILFGYTDNEMQFFKWASLQLDIMTRVANNYQVILTPRLAFNLPADEAPTYSERIKERCFNGTPTLDKCLNCFTGTFFHYPAIKYAQWRVASEGAPAYMYRYTYESEFSVVKRALWEVYDGAAHCEDMTFVFRTNTLLGDHISFPPQTNDDHMKDWMTTFVDNFIKCSNPTCTEDDVSSWPPITKDNFQFQVIDEPKVYRMSEFSEEDFNLVKFYDDIDSDARTNNELLGVTL